MITHELKTWPDYFQAIIENRKHFEYRRNDRNFKVGDELFLREWNNIEEKYTGRTVLVRITYILYSTEENFLTSIMPLPIGFCIMSIERCGDRIKEFINNYQMVVE